LAFGRTVEKLTINTLSGKELGQLTRTKAAPKIDILAPQPGAELGARTTLRLEVSDSDSRLSELQYQVAYSPNDGKSWVPLAVNVPGTLTTLSVNTAEIQETRGRGRIRAFASDGLNTSFADVTRLTPLFAKYENPAEPRLRLARVPDGFILSWPAASPNFLLQSSVDLTKWVNETNPPPTIVSNRFTVLLPVEKSRRFLRLTQ